MRITNTMINQKSITNMNGNKLSVDTLNTQMTTQKKISRPSEDPVIAIRALRLRSSLSEVNQFYEKNIPDAESWLELTETALKNMRDVVTEVYKECVNGATDTLTQTDRDAILQNIQALRTQIYKEGNADNAGRTIFTGYKTSSQLTFAKDESETTYEITEPVSFEDIEEKRRYTNLVEVPTSKDGLGDGVAFEDRPDEVMTNRLRLSYAALSDDVDIDGDPDVDVVLTTKDGGLKDDMGNDIIATTMSYADWAANDFSVGADQVLFIPENGELIFGDDVSEYLKRNKIDFAVNYKKQGFTEGELRPEHYFDCKNVSPGMNPIEYTKENQEIAYTIAYNETLVVNTQASDVFNASIGRDVDELTDAVKSAIAAHNKVDKIEEMLTLEQYSDEDSQKKLNQWLEAAKKEATYMDDNMKRLYSKSIGTFQGYLSDITAGVTDVGSKGDRLQLTKNRVSNQQTAFTKLKSDNEDRELSNIIIDFTSAYTAYQASLQAAAKVNQQTLLNYL